jgi:3-dehydroquinate synthase
VKAEADLRAELREIWRREWSQAVVVCDSNTQRLFGGEVEAVLRPLTGEILSLEFPAGERSKTRRTKERLEDEMLGRGADRSACVVAVGGGVVTDLAGYLAATYMRGIPVVNVATTLLAQVDAAIGGKTAVNTAAGKNLIGAFHPPAAVIIHSRALETLPLREMRNGLAEAIKNALVGDRALFEDLEGCGSLPRHIPRELVLRSAAVKEAIVAADLRDHGPRQQLNFGHTAAHAIEHATRYRVPHGRAVAAGMMVEGMIALEASGFPSEDLERLRLLLERVGLPTAPQCGFDDAAAALRYDKKRSGGRIRCSLPVRLGEMDSADGRWLHEISPRLFRSAWNAARRNPG